MVLVIQPDNGAQVVETTTEYQDDPASLPPLIENKIMSMNWSLEFPQLDPFTLLLLIQQAYYCDLKYQMTLSCRALAIKAKTEISLLDTKTFVESNIYQEYAHASVAKFSNGYTNYFQINSCHVEISHALSEYLYIDSRLRSHSRETFIDISKVVGSDISKVVGSDLSALSHTNEILSMFDGMEENLEYDDALNKFMESSDFLVTDDVNMDTEKLQEATSLLCDLIHIDEVLPYPLCSNVVERLVLILEKGTQYLQSMAVSILSSATYHNDCSELINKKVVPALVKLINHSFNQTAESVVVTLMHLARESSDHIPFIVSHGALEAVHDFVSNCTEGSFYVVLPMAKLLAVICRGANLSLDKEEVAIIILQKLFEMKWYSSTTKHTKRACYSLSYLSYGKPAVITKEVCKSVFDLLSHHDESVVSSALGVVGNIVRWGHGYQIQCLTEHCRLLQCLGESVLCSKSKIFRKEACQIISNLAVRSKTSVKNEAGLIKSLCKLLEKDESDVKMEAAWAIVNGIYA